MNQLFKPGNKLSLQLNDKEVSELSNVQQSILRQQFDMKMQQIINHYRSNESAASGSNGLLSKKQQPSVKQRQAKFQKLIQQKQSKHVRDQFDRMMYQDSKPEKSNMLKFYIKSYKNDQSQPLSVNRKKLISDLQDKLGL